MSNRSRPPSRPEPPARPERTRAPEAYFPTAPMPLPEVVEKDSDSVWAMWNDAVEAKAEKQPDFDSHESTVIMDLTELPKPSGSGERT